MHARLPPKGMCSGSRDLFKFWEISGNISETVRDTHSCNWSLIGNRMWPIERHQYRWPLVTWRSFLLFETFAFIRHCGSRPWWCAGGVIRGDVDNIAWWWSTMVDHSYSPVGITKSSLRKSVYNTHGIACSLYDSCAYCNDACSKLCR